MPNKREPGVVPDGYRAPQDADADEKPASSILAPFRHPPGGVFGVMQCVSSVLFKLLVYVFLRWIPTSLASPLIPALYFIYLFTSFVRDYHIRSAISDFTAQYHVTSAQSAADSIQRLADEIKVTDNKLGSEASAGSVANIPNTHGDQESDQKPSYADIIKRAKTEPPAATVALKEKPVSQLPSLHGVSFFDSIKALLFGASTTSSRVNLYVVLAHTLAFALFLDSFLSPYLFPSHWEYNLAFARTGALGPTYAKVHVRFPPPELGRPFNDSAVDTTHASFDSLAADTSLATTSFVNQPQPVELLVKYRRALNKTEEVDGFRKTARAYGKNHYSSPENVWLNGPMITLRPEHDWTASALVQDLWPSTTYEWGLSQFVPERLEQSDEVRIIERFLVTDTISRRNVFTTWPDPRLSSYMQSKSLGSRRIDSKQKVVVEDANPLEDPNHFTFASTSCVKPDFPYHPAQFWGWNWLLKLAGIGAEKDGIAQRNRVPGFDLMYKRAIAGRDSHPSLRFLLQLGDLIYSDVPHYGGPLTGAYRKLYRNLFASESFRRVFERIPVIGIYDDHEVINNWSGRDENSEELEAFQPASTAWKEYVGDVNPDSLEQGENYYTFQYGESAAFFVMDTRKYRTHTSMEDDEDKTMLGHRQKQELYQWLSSVNDTVAFKFVVSSVPFNTLWGGELDVDGQKDSWAAYNTERKEIAEVLRYVPNVIVLSGDRHEFAAVSVYDTITEFSTSPLSMFYLPVRTLSQDHGDGKIGIDKLLKYLPDGNHKWTEFEVDARDPYSPVVRVSVQIDGEEAWKVTYVGKSLRKTQGGIGGLVRNLLETLGFKFDFFYKA